MKPTKRYGFSRVLLIVAALIFYVLSGNVMALEAEMIPAIRAAIKAKGAHWTAGETSVLGIPAKQLCGSRLHPDAESASVPSNPEGTPSSLPSKFDWRHHNGHDWTTGIRNQNACGSCFIFAPVAAVEAAMKVQAGVYGYLAEPDFSEQFILSCETSGSCGDGYSSETLDILRDTGCPNEACLPYTATQSTPCGNRCSNWDQRIYKIDRWNHPGGYPNWMPTRTQIKQAIRDHGPVSTYMKVYTDFLSYRGGIYELTWGIFEGSHSVTLVGWDDSQSCWIAKNSWGPDWGETIDSQSTSSGATNGGWFRIKYGEVEIERQTEFVEVNLPNLTDYPHTGWTYSLIPRASTGCTWGNCQLSGALLGNADSTYLNFAGINEGAAPAPPFLTRFYIDGVYSYWGTWSRLFGGQGFHAVDFGPIRVKGGRHTCGVHIDYNEEVWESDETDLDNMEFRQFVWSPYALLNNTPETRTSPPEKDAWGNASPRWYNNDGFSFQAMPDGSDNYWSAVGILPSNSEADYDIRQYGIGNYSGSETGFGGGYLKWSGYSEGESDFVIVNVNKANSGTYYAGVINYNHGSGEYRIEEDTSEVLYTGTNGPFHKTEYNVLDIYEYYISSAGAYGFKLEQLGGDCDLGMSLYDDETTHAKKIEYMSGGFANSNGVGEDEYMVVDIPDAGYHGLVVWKAAAGDYSKPSSYKIKVGRCATPSALSNPFPVDGATNVSVDADLNWADSSDTEHYEVWLKEGSGAWTKLGTTETSRWDLPRLNEGTTYHWYVLAENICGEYAYVFWDFTTEDKTAPTPNPMTWATAPYELSTSRIRMTASEATDPTPPIEYYFTFLGSPTGGSGGSDSGWITSTTYTDESLDTNHQYSYQVTARDGKGNMTAHSGTCFEYTDIETPTGIIFGSIGSTFINVRSKGIPSGLDRGNSGLIVYNTTHNTNSGWKQNNNDWESNGLTPNTGYEFKARARNGDADLTPYSSGFKKWTRANIPGPKLFSNITQTSIQVNWTPNANPKATQYWCENITTGATSGWTMSLNWNNMGLACDTAYTYRVKARNGEGIETKWRVLGPQRTLPCGDPCEGDFNADGEVNNADLAIFAADFGRTNCLSLPGCEGDFNLDMDVDGSDLTVFAADFGRTDCP